MNEPLYIVGTRFGSGYPNGRYICTKIAGKVWDWYIVKAVLDYPSVRAVANDDGWSNARVAPYCHPFYFWPDARREPPKEYEGTVTGLEESDYNLSLVSAIERAIEEYKARGDSEAVDKLRERLQEAVENAQLVSA